jgi:hypothetical protein
MQHIDAMMRSHPVQPSTMDLIRRCAEACFTCAQVCAACADACLSEERVAELRECIRLNLDCADVCAATGNVISRLTRPHRVPMKALLQACIESCRTCGEICRTHASTHEHCRICAETCGDCDKACAALLAAIP